MTVQPEPFDKLRQPVDIPQRRHPMTPHLQPGHHDLSDPAASARLALACLDLTSLNEADTEADIARLCQRATGPFGPTAAVCVWPRLAAFARRELPPEVAVAAVANFPDGSADTMRAVADARAIVDAGAQEVDVVIPYRQLDAAPALLAAVRSACDGLVLKVILETGELADAQQVALACRIALEAGANFLKTSTGKVRVNATPQGARGLLHAIAADPAGRERVGFKPAGGIRTVADAQGYLALVREILGDTALSPQRFRIGASGLLDDIEVVLGGRTDGSASASTRPSAY
jgi:deoxyribose-phosphate aldolase